MAQTHARSGQVVSVLPLGDRLGSVRTTAILKANQLEVVRLVLPAGKGLPEHSPPGEITVQCHRRPHRVPDTHCLARARSGGLHPLARQ